MPPRIGSPRVVRVELAGPASTLFEAAVRKREAIQRVLGRGRMDGCELGGGDPYCEALRILRGALDDIVRPLPGAGGRPSVHGAEDGGSTIVELQHFQLYLVKAWAGLYRLRGQRYEHAGTARLADVGIVYPPFSGEVRVTIYRETLEAVASATVLRYTGDAKGGGLFLWDGSLRQLLWGKRPWSGGEKALSDLARKAAQALGMSLDGLHEEIDRLRRAAPLAASQWALEEALRAPGGRTGDLRWVAYIEWMEKMLAVRDFLLEAWSRGVWPVFIVKTSRSQSLINHHIQERFKTKGREDLPGVWKAFTDVALLAWYEPVEPLWTLPVVRRGLTGLISLDEEKAKPFRLPEYLGVGDFYSERLGVVDFYVRLARGVPVLKVQVAVDLYGETGLFDGERAREVALEVVGWLLLLAQGTGYPWKLVEADRNAHIMEREVRSVLHLLGLQAMASPRRSLGVHEVVPR